jgi:hypothetical protein
MDDVVAAALDAVRLAPVEYMLEPLQARVIRRCRAVVGGQLEERAPGLVHE